LLGIPTILARPRVHHSLKIALVLVRLDHVARIIVNANHGVMRTAEKLCVSDCIADYVSLALPLAISSSAVVEIAVTTSGIWKKE